MSSPFAEEDGPQPPRVLKAPMEIAATLRQLQQNHDPLVISFHERNQRFQSFLIEVDPDKGRLIFDELVPNDGERFLKNAEPFSVESSREGVRVAWQCDDSAQISEHDGLRCYFCAMPSEVLYHQRRSAFRATLKLGELVAISLKGEKLAKPLSGQMLDISATGCKIRIAGDVSQSLKPGMIYEELVAQLPFGAMTAPIELRHVHYNEKLDTSMLGVRFYRMSGLVQRQVERFVYQLQREAKRLESDTFL
ncbi:MULTISPECIES: flagellar brake protein [Pseudomonas]|uniref:C-di-GMP-binding flagellar brake protein YcgR, contains PilZNR and PilZ domains n=1 Tax=Pseudomonas segetis TaxID=298908 RepID=A0A239JTS2_9PSED|nr:MULTISPECIES: flagellar brake protein [Pseudomonas]SNT08848.1 c-di-GMP-binding flagellar brake protein YcgR, contains PilZNR and PilZ domains [Pseudomonas segetis]